MKIRLVWKVLLMGRKKVRSPSEQFLMDGQLLPLFLEATEHCCEALGGLDASGDTVGDLHGM